LLLPSRLGCFLHVVFDAMMTVDRSKKSFDFALPHANLNSDLGTGTLAQIVRVNGECGYERRKRVL
jgi:hypothetical protein